MQLTADIIAGHIGGTVEGDPTAAVSDFAKIEEARPGQITFLANPKYTHYIYSTRASIVLVGRDFVAEEPVSATLIRVDVDTGDYHFMIRLTDKAGWQSFKAVSLKMR